MTLSGPDRYELKLNARNYRVSRPDGATSFKGLAAKVWPKLYVFVAGHTPVYVGITRRPMSARLRVGWRATGKGGYYGYALRHHLRSASLWIWYANADRERTRRDLETTEAEVAYLVRRTGQWPRFQTEIHFYKSSADHRRIAANIVRVILRAR
jgi:hypothetical protein